jgi:hypothetical protein
VVVALDQLLIAPVCHTLRVVEGTARPGGGIYATPQAVTQLGDCYFYHTMDIPSYGHVDGEWDLRKGIAAYLGNFDFTGKRVLELGTADGFVGFQMEQRGAELVAYDLSPAQDWDVVPFARSDPQSFLSQRRERIRRLNNAFWLCHEAFGSRARLVHGDVYSVPSEIGPVDVSVFGSILLHVRDPFRTLQQSLRITRQAVIVTDLLGRLSFAPHFGRVRDFLPARSRRPSLRFLPDWRTGRFEDAWWRLSPGIVTAFLGVLGFEKTAVSFHRQPLQGRARRLFTVVGHRTRPMP